MGLVVVPVGYVADFGGSGGLLAGLTIGPGMEAEALAPPLAGAKLRTPPEGAKLAPTEPEAVAPPLEGVKPSRAEAVEASKAALAYGLAGALAPQPPLELGGGAMLGAGGAMGADDPPSPFAEPLRDAAAARDIPAAAEIDRAAVAPAMPIPAPAIPAAVERLAVSGFEPKKMAPRITGMDKYKAIGTTAAMVTAMSKLGTAIVLSARPRPAPALSVPIPAAPPPATAAPNIYSPRAKSRMSTNASPSPQIATITEVSTKRVPAPFVQLVANMPKQIGEIATNRSILTF